MAASFPHEIVPVTDEEDAILKKYYKDYTRRFVRVGGYLAPALYGDHAADIYNLEVRPDDIWVVTYARSGTTWLQELVWLVANNMDFASSSSIALSKRFAFIEYPTRQAEVPKKRATTNSSIRATHDDFHTLPLVPSQRYVKTHLPLSLLPPSLLDKAKVFYVARDPRDVAVSYFFMQQMYSYLDETVQFQEFWELFKNNLVFHTPIFNHIEESWQKRDHPNLLFLFYEEMQKDLRSVIDRVCLFLNKEYSSEQKAKLVEHLSLANMKKNSPYPNKDEKSAEHKFIRKGKSGNWVNYFNDEMKKEAEEFMEKHLSATDLRFPDINS